MQITLVSMPSDLITVNNLHAAERGANKLGSTAIAALTFDIFDMHCSACASLIEDKLRRSPGVLRARVHYSTQRARISFDPDVSNEVHLLSVIGQMGYSASAESSQSRADMIKWQRRRHIWQFGLATLCVMQIMMLTLPRFLAGADMEPELAPLLDWTALALLLPVVVVCARSFYRGALREFRMRRPGMDMAIVLGIVSAFAGSVWHLINGTGALYFDSVAMFVALLLGVRWLAWEQRERNQAAIQRASSSVTTATVMRFRGDHRDQSMHPVAVSTIQPGDCLWIRTGEAIPVDCVLESGSAVCDEALLTGESAQVRHAAGEALIAGAINCGGAITVRAVASVDESTERRLLSLADESAKPETLALADVVARYFMPVLLVVASLTFLVMLPSGVSVALERAIAVLIISCPCALALAAPAVQARAFAGLLSRGIVLRRVAALDRLGQADYFLLDKTGTLTTPNLIGLSGLRADYTERRALDLIAVLEASANHPLSVALRAAALPEPSGEGLALRGLRWAPGEGVYGIVDGTEFCLGREGFVRGFANLPAAAFDREHLWLADHFGLICTIELGETLKPGAFELVTALQRGGTVEILSGDHEDKSKHIAQLLGVQATPGAQTPEKKAQRVKALQQAGHTVVMIGDGVNDSVGFAGADVAIAVGSATDATRASADIVCTTDQLSTITDCIDYAARVRSVMRSNFAWAIAYNVIAIPFAVAGFIDPLIASIGMAASSAVVMLNVMRLDVGTA